MRQVLWNMNSCLFHQSFRLLCFLLALHFLLFVHWNSYFSGLEFSLFRDVREVEPYLLQVNSKMRIVEQQLDSANYSRAASVHFD